MRRRYVVLGLAALAGCAPRRLPPPPAAPRVASAAELLPSDLDVVARLDLARMKSALGTITPERLLHEGLMRAGATGEVGDELLLRTLLEADLAYLAYRPSPLLLPLDRVLALQGRFGPITQAPHGFEGGIDLGADVRYWDRRRDGPFSRSSVARLYAVGSRVRAFVSEAELDSVERALDGLSEPRPLVAPEEGTLSLALRPRLLGQLVGATLRELLQDSKSLDVVVDLESDLASLRASLEAPSSAHAEQLASAARTVVRSALGARASGAELRTMGSRVSFTFRVSRAELASFDLLGRARAPGGPGDAW